MAFPRPAVVAEIRRSPGSGGRRAPGRSWSEFAPGLAAFGAVLDAVGID